MANASDGDTIAFSSTGATLTSKLFIRKKITIKGPATIRQTGYQHRIFIVNDGVKATLKKLTLTGGVSSDGGALCNYGDLTMEDCVVSGNTASGSCGGIAHSNGTLKAEGCVVRNNTSGGDAGGLETDGIVEMKKCTIANNVAQGKGGGVFNSVGRDNCSLKDKSMVKGNAPDQISGLYKADDNCTVGSAPNRSATVRRGIPASALTFTQCEGVCSWSIMKYFYRSFYILSSMEMTGMEHAVRIGKRGRGATAVGAAVALLLALPLMRFPSPGSDVPKGRERSR